jgi:SAM-dependent methyltransferase
MTAVDAWGGSVNQHPDLYDIAYPDAYAEVLMYSKLSCASDIFEVGVGTGRIAIPLAQTGRNVYGIDISEAMIDTCKHKWNTLNNKTGSLIVYRADILDIVITRQFEYVIIPFTTFNYLRGYEEYVKCLRVLSELMTSTSILCIELLTENTVPKMYSNSLDYDLAWIRSFTASSDLQYWRRASYDVDTQLVIQERRYIEIDKNTGKRISEKDILWRNRLIHDIEFEKLLKLSGLVVEKRYGTYNLGPLTRESCTAIYVIRRGE